MEYVLVKSGRSFPGLDPFEPFFQAFPHLFKEIVKLPDITLLAGNQKNQLHCVRFLEELYCAGEGSRELVVFDVDTS
jgi:hypothetical protein